MENKSEITGENKDAIISLFNRFGIKATAQRMEIARILMSKPQHLCAEEVLHLVNRKADLVSKATVYNTLNLFVEKGLIRQVNIDSQKICYDSNTHPHCHFYNEDTGELIDFKPHGMMIETIPTSPENTVKTGIEVIVRVKNKS